MKGFWKWFFIVLGVLVLIGISCAVALFFFRGGAGRMHPGAFAVRRGVMGGMMLGMGGLMFLRFLFPLGILVLAGFGVAYFVKTSKKPAPLAGVTANTPVVTTCSHCGKVLASDWTSCPYCGTKIEPPSAPVPQA